jgi:hypothetical protein
MAFASQKWPDAVQEDLLPFAVLVFGGESSVHREIPQADLVIFAALLANTSEKELQEVAAGQESALFDDYSRSQALQSVR